MDNRSLLHDSAVVTAKALLEIIAPVLRDDEKRDVYEAFYSACKAGIEAYVIQRNREVQRLNPTRN
jgi:hypothetical protein